MKKNTHNANTPFRKNYANSRNKREMKKSRVPSAQECAESPEECVRAGGISAPRGLRAAPAHLEPKAGSGTSSCGTAAPLGGKTPDPDSRREHQGLQSYRSLLSRQIPLGSAAELARPGAAPLRWPEEPRGAPGGRAAPARPALRQLPARAEPPCSRLTPGRARRPRPVEKRVFNGAEVNRHPGRLGAGSHSHSRGGQRQRHRTATAPVPAALWSQHSPVPVRPRPSRLGKAGNAPLSSRRRSPHPSRAASLGTPPTPRRAPHRPAGRTHRRSRARTARPLQRGRGLRGRAGEEPGGGRSRR